MRFTRLEARVYYFDTLEANRGSKVVVSWLTPVWRPRRNQGAAGE